MVGYAGHSLGEYSALVAAGILELDAAARLVAARGAAMLAAAEAEPGTMIAVIGAPADAIADALAPLQATGRAGVGSRTYNAPDQTVVAGDTTGIEAREGRVQGVGKVVALPVGGAFHSPLMAAAEVRAPDALATTDVRGRHRARSSPTSTRDRIAVARNGSTSSHGSSPRRCAGPSRSGRCSTTCGCRRVRRDRTGQHPVEPGEAHRPRDADRAG